MNDHKIVVRTFVNVTQASLFAQKLTNNSKQTFRLILLKVRDFRPVRSKLGSF